MKMKIKREEGKGIKELRKKHRNAEMKFLLS